MGDGLVVDAPTGRQEGRQCELILEWFCVMVLSRGPLVGNGVWVCVYAVGLRAWWQVSRRVVRERGRRESSQTSKIVQEDLLPSFRSALEAVL